MVGVLFESEPDDGVAGGGFWPSGMTMGVGLVLPPPLSPLLSLAESESSCGGQSTDVGGQLSALPDPDEDESEGAQPDAAPKSPAVVQSALAMPIGATIHPTNEMTAAAVRSLTVFTASGCRRRH